LKQHDYSYDINRIIYKAGELRLNSLENYSLYLDGWLSSLNSTSSEKREHIEKTVEFLYSLLNERDYSDAYDDGYVAGKQDCDCHCDCY